MKKYLFVIFINILLSLLQTSLFAELFGIELNPNIVFAFALSILLIDETELSLFSAFIGGLLIDMVTFRIIGVTALSLTLFVFSVFLIRKYIFKSFPFQILVIFITSLIYYFLINNQINNYIISGITSSLFNTVICLIFYVIMQSTTGKLFKSEYKIKS